MAVALLHGGVRILIERRVSLRRNHHARPSSRAVRFDFAFRGHPPRFRPALLQAVLAWTAGARVALTSPDPGAVKAFRANLEAIVRETRATGAAVVLTNLPTILSSQGNTPAELRTARGKLGIDWNLDHLQLFQEQIDEVCRMSGASCILNLFPIAEAGKGGVFLDHCHPNEAGHVLIADELYDYFAANVVARPPG